MASKISYDREMTAHAKSNGYPLTAISFDDRHLTKEQGRRIGAITRLGPTTPEKAKQLLDFMLKWMNED